MDQSVSSGTTRIPLGVCIGWASGSIGAAIMLNTFGVLLLRFMTDSLGIAAVTASGMIAISKLYDAAIDPFVGAISDRWGGQIGRRRPFLLVSAIMCPVSLLALFIVPDFAAPATTRTYIFLALIAYSTAYAVWSVPYMAMAAEMTDDYRDRSRLMAWRIFGGALGQSLAAICGPWLLVYWGRDRPGYEHMAFVLAAIVLASCAISFRSTRGARFHPRNEAMPYRWSQQMRLAWSNVPFRSLIASKSAMYVGGSASAATNAYFTTYVIQASDWWLGTYYILLTMGTIGSMPIWLAVNRHRDKKACYIAAVVIYSLSSLSWLTAAAHEPFTLLAIRVLVFGFGLGGFILFGQSMLPDTIEYDFRRTGLRREGVFSSIFVLVEKVSNAVGVALTGAMLGTMGYISGTLSASAHQPPSAIHAIFLGFAIFPAVFSVLCMLAMMPYDLSERRLKEAHLIRQE